MRLRESACRAGQPYPIPCAVVRRYALPQSGRISAWKDAPPAKRQALHRQVPPLDKVLRAASVYGDFGRILVPRYTMCKATEVTPSWWRIVCASLERTMSYQQPSLISCLRPSACFNKGSSAILWAAFVAGHNILCFIVNNLLDQKQIFFGNRSCW